MVEPAISTKTIQAVRSDSATDFRYPLKLISFLSTDNRSTAKVPMLPASVGVKKPCISPPTTTTKIRTTQKTSGREAILCFHVDFSPIGHKAGLILHQP